MDDPNCSFEEIVVDDPNTVLEEVVISASNGDYEEVVIDDPGCSSSSKYSPSVGGDDKDAPGKNSASSDITTSPDSSQSKTQHFAPVMPVTEPHIVPQLHNVVSTIDLNCKLNLLRIALHARNAEYNPKRFAAVIMRIRNPTTTALIFSTGKVVITGARNEDLSNLAARKYARIIQKLGFDVKCVHFKIHNIVASCDVKFPIHIEKLYANNYFFCRYEPELFPGLVYRMVRPRVALLIFVSGRIVLTGAKSRAELQEAFQNIYPTLLQFKKQ